ncbi:MAG: hypothetical protein Ct9H90mP6_07190 [Gammaproteobacteria bacterium]|nr:MAG: hypothetical protein Ct9H90mP6_07190 [Gammaproteobacteria bacterium]
MEKLNKAIPQKFDKETKEKFIESFNAVNKRLKSIFPIMFGGGNAELSLTDNSYLNAGVKLMARPQVKRIRSFAVIRRRKGYDRFSFSLCFI